MRRPQPRYRRLSVAGLVLALVLALAPLSTDDPVDAAANRRHVAGVAMGGSWPGLPNSQILADLDGVADSGAAYIRLTFNWAALERTRGNYSFERMSFISREAVKRGLDVIAVLAYTPRWARIAECDTSIFCRPKDIDDYARFVEAAVGHFSPLGVSTYELWNEPNILAFFKPAPDPVWYANLLRTAGPAVRRANPRARILFGGLSPAPDAANGNRIHPVTFLTRVYAEGGVKQHFDALAMHPYSYPSSPRKQASWNAFAGVMPELRRTMQDNGDGGKQIWGTEFGAPTAGQGAVDDETQARFVREALEMQEEWDWLGPIIFYNYRNLGTDPHDREDHFGMVTYQGQRKQSYWALQQMLARGQSGGVETTTTTRPRATTSTTAPPATTSTAPTTTTTTRPGPREPFGGVTFPIGWEQSSTQVIGADLDRAVALGAESVRVYFPWSDIESTRGTLDFAANRRVVDAAAARGLGVIGVLATAPAWARHPECVEYERCRPVDVDTFQQFTKETVTEFAARGVHIWEVWDEPNVRTSFQPAPDPAVYAAMLRGARAAIRFNDPDSGVVVMGGLAPAPDDENGLRIHPLTFVQRVYDNNGAWGADHIAVQPYTYPVGPAGGESWNAFSTVMPDLWTFLRSRGQSDKQIWVTGYGAPTNGTNSVSETAQARFFEEAFDLQVQWPWLGPIFVDTVRDAGSDPNEAADHFGLVTADGRQKPAWFTVRALLHGQPAPPPPASTTTTTNRRPTTTTTRPGTSPTTRPGAGSGESTAEVPDLGPAVFCTRLFCIEIASGSN